MKRLKIFTVPDLMEILKIDSTDTLYDCFAKGIIKAHKAIVGSYWEVDRVDLLHFLKTDLIAEHMKKFKKPTVPDVLVLKDDVYTVREVAELFDCKMWQIRFLIYTRRLRAVNLGIQWRIPRAALKKYAEAQNAKVKIRETSADEERVEWDDVDFEEDYAYASGNYLIKTLEIGASMNAVILKGTVASALFTGETRNGAARCNFIIKTFDYYNEMDEPIYRTIPVVAFGNRATKCMKHLSVGQTVYVEGQISSWKNDYTGRYYTNIVVDRVEWNKKRISA